MSSSRRAVAVASLVVAGTACGILLVEAALRVARIESPGFYAVDPHLGLAHQPGASGWFRHEGGSFVRINSHGMRDREHAFVKPRGTVRIAMLGDSYVQAMQVPQEQNLCSVLENELRARRAFGGRQVEVLDFGVASFGTAQELLMLRHRVWRFEPDVVLLAFLSLNDVKENARALIGEDWRPYFTLEGEHLVLDTSFRRSRRHLVTREAGWRAKKAVMERSRLLQMASFASRNRHRHTAPAGPDDATQIYREPSDPRWQEAWRVTERLLVALRDECERHGAGFLVVTLSNPVQVHPDRDVRAALEEQLGVRDLFYPDQRIQALGAQAGFPVLNLAVELQAWAEAHATCVHGFENCLPCDGHWNEIGHRLAGTRIAEYLGASWLLVEAPAPDPAEGGALARSRPQSPSPGDPSAQE